MYPTIFNVVMDASIRHWVTLFTPAEAGIEVFKKTVHDLEVYLYADNGIIALPQTERLQRSFDVLTDHFEWFGLHGGRLEREMLLQIYSLIHSIIVALEK